MFYYTRWGIYNIYVNFCKSYNRIYTKSYLSLMKDLSLKKIPSKLTVYKKT